MNSETRMKRAVRTRSRFALFLGAALLAIGVIAAPVGAAGTPGRHSGTGSTSRPGGHTNTNWQQHDRAVYVVSTLNAPLCSNGQQLSTVLWSHDSARNFEVLGSTQDPNLYFVVVRKADKTLVGIYAYQFGWKLPKGVRSAECVEQAPSPIAANFQRGQLVRVGRFRTTFPQS